MLAGCAASDEMAEPADSVVGTPVLFTSGNENLAVTRATIPYMAQGSRFICSMYYHAKNNDTDDTDFDVVDPIEGGTMTTASLQISNTLGNANYLTGQFYWQNRLNHAFLALADYNRLNETPVVNGKNVTYDLARGTRQSISEQPDPILALTIAKPSGSTQEGNRVRLYFKHQFALVQVNVKSSEDNSAEITAEQIEKVELLGVSTEGIVSTHLHPDGTVDATKAKDVDLDQYTDEQLANNKWGTSFSLFDMATGIKDEEGHDEGYAVGFLKSYNAITFGHLWAIRVTWHEGTADDPGVVHVSTYEVPETNETDVPLRTLASGMKYVYDLEVRRGILAVIRTQVLDWKQKEELVYGTDGTIMN
ncbi:fimbrillin family protein [Prevotella sp. E9-3]|uniref:fimbrillin family protein n=1 Tax=Prevotella sp. E9-3 TaxID=2913621 RepID=UPI001EDB5F6D|nr:fimbrillin family protein [Prevotella sp. E9-3]UKK48726.1 fimbrillin family protein [Prevotella sp. E9-3]